ncbi:MAG TPA: type IV toxin-antitoxin system AbiEi family antitoxin domain-containing protein [Solirubrobacteraceae bacterium]|jgi:very-short-patch-repair endonuclease
MEITPAYREFLAARRELAAIATRQKGVITRAQLFDLGFSSSGISRLIAAGHLHRIHRGVYAVGHTALTLHGRWMAAVLACGPEAVLSHHAAAALHELRTTPGGLIDVTAPGKRDHDGVRCHTARMLLPPGDRTTIQGLPVTSLERTYLDYAEVATPRQLDEALTQGERSERLNFLRLKATLQRTPGRRGAKVLARALERHTPDDPRLRSKLEKLALARIRAAGLPEPQCNVYVDGILVDFYWPEADLVVEIDSYTFHGGKPSFEQDRRRDTIHTLAGRRTLRPTAHRIEHEPDAVISEISRLLSVAGARTGQ